MNIYDSSKKLSNIQTEAYTASLFGIAVGGEEVYCESGIAKTTFERPFWSGLFFDAYALLPAYVISFRKSSSVCAESTSLKKDEKVEGVAGFNDIVVLKNGDILTNVKVTVTAKELVVQTADGLTTVYKKVEVQTVKKGK